MNLYSRATLLFICLAVINSETTDILQTETDSETPVPIDEFILCRNCGTEVSDSHYLFPKLSPESQYAFNETLFNKERVLIQILSNSFSIDYPIITSVKSDCEGVGEWQWNDPWFPGYLWKPCICSTCGAHVGWVFAPTDAALVSSKPFFGLVLSNLIGETFADSLLKFPGQYNNNGSH